MNQLIKEIPLDAGGKVYSLRITHFGLRMLERKRGSTWPKMLAELQSDPSLDLMSDFLWAALQGEESSPSEREIGEIMDAVGSEAAGNAIGEALKAFAGVRDSEKAPRPPKGPQPNGTGMSSSRASSRQASTPKSSGG